VELRWGRIGLWPTQDFGISLFLLLGWPTKALYLEKNLAPLHLSPPRKITEAPPLVLMMPCTGLKHPTFSDVV
jgi:hypothetical protein